MSVDPFPCPKNPPCGHLHVGCVGHNRAGMPCRCRPMKISGTERPRCRNHLGQKEETVRADYEVAQVLRIRADDARRTAEALGLHATDAASVLDALLNNFNDALAWQAVIKEMISNLQETRYQSGSAGEQARSEITWLERNLDRIARIGADLLRLGIEERLARVAERQQTAVIDAIEAGLAELAPQLGLDLTAASVRPILAKHLREVAE